MVASLGAGGAERVLALLAGHWTSRGHAVTVIAFDGEHDPIFHDFGPLVRLRRLDIPATAAGGAAAMARTGRRLRAARAALRAEAPDVVISFLFKINVIALLAGLGLGIPIIVSERNHPGRQQSHRLWRLLRARLYPRAAAVVLQTEASRRTLPAALAGTGIVIANPVVAWPRSPEPTNPKILAAVGRLDDQKGFDLLITAFAGIAAAHPQWTLVIWGDGPRRADLLARIDRLGLGRRVRLPGVSASPGAWISAASDFALSSRFEGFGNALAEAMAAGLPVVAFACEFGVAEIATDGVDSLLVPPEDVPALAAALDRLLGDAALRTRLGAAAAIAARRFAAAEIFAQWDALIDATTARSRGIASHRRIRAADTAPAAR